jgi:DNA invertase Pin-like site-specific DNA recombinase
MAGYARVSTDHQSLDGQRDALTTAGCERIFADQLSEVRDDRPGLAGLLEYLRAGDTVVVVALDRLGRSLSGVIRTVETLTERGVLLRSLREGVDYSTPTGRMLAAIFAALAGYERDLMHERAAAARQAARLRGRHTGRPSRLTDAQARQVRALRRDAETAGELMLSFGVSRATVYRVLQQDPLTTEADTAVMTNTPHATAALDATGRWGSG